MAAAAGSEGCVLLLLQRGQQQPAEPSPKQLVVGGNCGGCKSGGGGDASSSVCLADRTGFTPLHAAAYRGHASVCELLLRWGADAGALCSANAHAAELGGDGDGKEHSVGENIGEKRRRPPAGAARGQQALMPPDGLAEQAGHHALAQRLRAARESV